MLIAGATVSTRQPNGCPVDPCGHIVDYVRSCYRTMMAFGTSESYARMVRWHFTEPTATPLGIPTAFCSRNWADPDPYPEVGEVWGATRQWVDGSFPIALPGNGHFCGDAATWADGYPAANPPDLVRTDYGVSLCCGAELYPPGDLVLLLFPGPFPGPCPLCRQLPSHVNLRLTIVGFTGAPPILCTGATGINVTNLAAVQDFDGDTFCVRTWSLPPRFVGFLRLFPGLTQFSVVDDTLTLLAQFEQVPAVGHCGPPYSFTAADLVVTSACVDPGVVVVIFPQY